MGPVLQSELGPLRGSPVDESQFQLSPPTDDSIRVFPSVEGSDGVERGVIREDPPGCQGHGPTDPLSCPGAPGIPKNRLAGTGLTRRVQLRPRPELMMHRNLRLNQQKILSSHPTSSSRSTAPTAIRPPSLVVFFSSLRDWPFSFCQNPSFWYHRFFPILEAGSLIVMRT